jgi:hypothetical protein
MHWPKASLGGDQQARVQSDQTVLVTAKQGGWTVRAVAKDTQVKLNLKGDYQASVHSDQMVLVVAS